MIYVCGNRETVRERYDCTDDQAEEAIQAACDALMDSRYDWDLSFSFQDWNGGRHHQYHERIGLIAYQYKHEAGDASDASDAMDEVAQ